MKSVFQTLKPKEIIWIMDQIDVIAIETKETYDIDFAGAKNIKIPNTASIRLCSVEKMTHKRIGIRIKLDCKEELPMALKKLFAHDVVITEVAHPR
jgi:hypothetical protein